MESSSIGHKPYKRPNRSAAARRQQRERAQARALGHLLRSISSLKSHRGNAPANILKQAAQHLSPAVPTHAPATAPHVFSQFNANAVPFVPASTSSHSEHSVYLCLPEFVPSVNKPANVEHPVSLILPDSLPSAQDSYVQMIQRLEALEMKIDYWCKFSKLVDASSVGDNVISKLEEDVPSTDALEHDLEQPRDNVYAESVTPMQALKAQSSTQPSGVIDINPADSQSHEDVCLDAAVNQCQNLDLKAYSFTRVANDVSAESGASGAHTSASEADSFRQSPPSSLPVVAPTTQWWSCKVCGYKLPTDMLLQKHGGKCCQVEANRTPVTM